MSFPKHTTITQGSGSETVSLNVTGLSTSLTGPPPKETPVEITFSAQGQPGTLYYKYYQASGYQTQNYGNWQPLRDWSTDNSLTWLTYDEGHYVIVAYVTNDPSRESYQQAGLSIETQGNSSNSIVIQNLTTTMTYPQPSNTPITLNTSATGGSGQLFYKYWYCKGIGGSWYPIREHSTSNSCTWTPPEEGLYTVVVWVSDTQSATDYSIAGMTCTIGD